MLPVKTRHSRLNSLDQSTPHGAAHEVSADCKDEMRLGRSQGEAPWDDQSGGAGHKMTPPVALRPKGQVTS